MKNRNIKIGGKPQAATELHGILAIQPGMGNIIVGYDFRGVGGSTYPIGEGTHPFRMDPEGSPRAYRLYDHKPPIYVNELSVMAHSSDVCEVVFVPPREEMALPK